MPEIDLGQVSPPDDDPDLLSFGGEPGGGADRRDPAGDGWAGDGWAGDGWAGDGWAGDGWARRLRWLPARWRRPVPRGVVAVVSALAAGVAVAIYLDPPSGRPADPPPEPAGLLTPESWLDVRESGGGPPWEQPPPEGPRWEAAVAEHPPEALLVVPLDGFTPRLIGLPPGSYRVLSSCQLAVRPETIPESVEFQVVLREGGGMGGDALELTCDGALQTLHERLRVPDYQAVMVESYPVFDGPEGEDQWLAVEQAEPVVVISFTQG